VAKSRRSRHLAIAALAVTAALPLLAEPAGAAGLRAGAGRADITPQTGYFLFGWVRSDARAQGQLTRLFARAIVLKRGKRKVALVSADLGALPNGLVADAAERVSGRGFSDRNVIVSASHTHSAPAGYFNYPAFNTVAPTDTTPTDFELAPAADPQLYSFLARRLAAAIRRADRDLGPAQAGWGSVRLLGLTQNRSIEAHLADHGIGREFGAGGVDLDPLGYPHTIDPNVDVLRVDKLRRGRRVPIGIWSSFADHGTVVKPTFAYYNGDHHAAAARIAERRIRRIGRVPQGQEVVNSYGNSDEGDITAGIQHSGPAGAFEVGRREALAMVKAWRRAGRRMHRRPQLALRWTRACFCGRETAVGSVDNRAAVGLPFLTGSEENRGPLYDETGVPFEGYRLPVSNGPQGNKVVAISDTGQFPTAVPLTALRIGSRAIITVPGEMTEEMGRRIRDAALQAGRGAGIRRIAISGLANDFVQYVTTPEEYDRQHYEGGTTLFGRAEGVFIEEHLAELVARIAARRPAPAPDPFDPRNGVTDEAPPFGSGASQGQPISQPPATARLDRAEFRWLGGERGLDRPLDRPFIIVQRRTRGRWRHADDDLGLRILWTVDGGGVYRALWEAPLDARRGRYRFRVSANRYRLLSAPFRLLGAGDLEARVLESGGGRAVLTLEYPRPVENRDLTWRPLTARAGRIALGPGARDVAIRARGRRFILHGPPGTPVTLGPGAVRDRYGNANANPLSFQL
jgi:neutral ceramidase